MARSQEYPYASPLTRMIYRRGSITSQFSQLVPALHIRLTTGVWEWVKYLVSYYRQCRWSIRPLHRRALQSNFTWNSGSHC
ncbi:hypothetical protein LY78DRAFT_718937 [Colletotrichum sublineola]|nr:hypothetical protein LY78DRAFT_718937 [Colletotrichum sublineola]